MALNWSKFFKINARYKSEQVFDSESMSMIEDAYFCLDMHAIHFIRTYIQIYSRHRKTQGFNGTIRTVVVCADFTC